MPQSPSTHGLIWVVVTLSALMQGCISNTMYRTEFAGACGWGDKTCSHSIEMENGPATVENFDAIRSSSQAAIAIVEISEQGALWDRNQLTLAEGLIASGGEDQMVLVYIHGWQHDARADDGDVAMFRDAVMKYSQLIKRSGRNSKVTGIYVGWRGKSFWGNALSNFWTFFGRKFTSIEVGRGALVDVLNTVERATVATESRLVTVGHSFGASATYNALGTVLISRIGRPPIKTKTSSEMDVSFGDLVLLINPAMEGMQMWPLVSALDERIRQRGSGPTPKPLYPRIIVLQSREDYAVGLAFPFARIFTTLSESYSCGSETCKTGRNVSEFSLDIRSPGFLNAFVTHLVDPVKSPDRGKTKNQDTPLCQYESDRSKEQDLKLPEFNAKGGFFSPGASAAFEPEAPYNINSPLWVASVHKDIISGHASLDKDKKLQCMILDLMYAVRANSQGVFRENSE